MLWLVIIRTVFRWLFNLVHVRTSLFWSVGRFSFPKRRFWRIGGHEILPKKRRGMSASRGQWSKNWLTVSTDPQIHSGESTTDLRWRSRLSELQPSLSLVYRIWTLRDPKLNIVLGFDIFELRDCLKEVRDGRLLTLRWRSLHIRTVAGRNEFFILCSCSYRWNFFCSS